MLSSSLWPVNRLKKTKMYSSSSEWHALFPDSLAFGAQLGSSIFAGCQFPDATLSRTDLRIVFGPAAGPAARRFYFRGRLVERGFSASRLVHPSRDCLPTGPDPGCDSRFRPASTGIGFSRLLGGCASFPALRVLPLCSQVAFPFAGGRCCFQHPPTFGSYCPGRLFPACRPGLGGLDSFRD
jgi:hypothetical protein